LRVSPVELSPGRKLFVARRSHRVVEARDVDPAVATLQIGEDMSQRVDGIGCDATERAGVQVDGRATGMELDVQESPQRRRERGMALLVHAAVPNEDRVGPELRAM